MTKFPLNSVKLMNLYAKYANRTFRQIENIKLTRNATILDTFNEFAKIYKYNRLGLLNEIEKTDIDEEQDIKKQCIIDLKNEIMVLEKGKLIEIPFLKDLSNEKWTFNHGNFLREGIIPKILALDTIPTINFSVSYGKETSLVSRKGNLILPDQTIEEPVYKAHVSKDDSENLLSILAIDLAPVADSPIVLNELPHDSVFDYIPPHPFRGSLFHRIMFLLLKQESKLDVNELKSLKFNQVSDPEDVLLNSLEYEPLLAPRFISKTMDFVNKNQLKIVGFQWHRTHWIKPVKEICEKIGIKERFFGEYTGVYREIIENPTERFVPPKREAINSLS
ncbi:hypothetical protein ROZALSC1DRAFT_28912 [Rozella allomycis CSF55]|uniref:PEBP-like protein n=1 Tax=Rozella allomycis (strain CSF55) TaxID=988480 RepID=A0A075AUN4_ROZAC|nr:hypothetical protein O9G_002586 [Rozella allomycis CSF55]RKP19500.1 hypothetical protein ROZALSC1DRAFT_28912 [Rozella allomycis CSF55]|eukprot:EPZ32234.1 hypothetical protein O9G_002586 [Rozella allomycis CSF55]